MGKPVAGFLKTLIDIIAAIAKGWVEKKVPFSHKPGVNVGSDIKQEGPR